MRNRNHRTLLLGTVILAGMLVAPGCALFGEVTSPVYMTMDEGDVSLSVPGITLEGHVKGLDLRRGVLSAGESAASWSGNKVEVGQGQPSVSDPYEGGGSSPK